MTTMTTRDNDGDSDEVPKQVSQSPEVTGGCFITFGGRRSENEADIIENRAWSQLYLNGAIFGLLFGYVSQ